MKLKHFDRFQHYYLDRAWQKFMDEEDVAECLRALITMEDPQDTIETLHSRLRDYPAKDPAHGQWRTWGFVPPFHAQPADIYVTNPLETEGQHEQALAIEVTETGALVICIEKRERVLPSSAINDKLFERAQAMKEREQRDLTRKDYAVLKEEVTAALLVNAPVRRSRIYVMFDEKDMLVFTGSQKAAEETNGLIRTAFSSLPTVPSFQNEIILQKFFTSILQHDEEVYEKFKPGAHIKLRNEEGEVITVKDGDLEDRRYTDLLKQGFVPIELEIDYHHNKPGLEHVFVKMNHKGDVKAFSTSSNGDDSEADFESMYERGEDGLATKMAELWVIVRAVRELLIALYDAGTMLPRTDLSEYQDGDELAIEKEAAEKAKGSPTAAEPEEPADESDFEDDDDMWDVENDDDDI